MQEFKYVTCHGLLGSYDDCVNLLDYDSAFGAEEVLFLWFGNSITNLPWKTAVDLVHRLLCVKNTRTNLLLPVDGCRNDELIENAYDLPGGQSRLFMRNGLQHANELLGHDVFDSADWDFEGHWDPVESMHSSYHVAKRDLTLLVDGQTLSITKGEKIHGISSGKWDSEIIGRLCKAAGVNIDRQWTRATENFSESLFSEVEDKQQMLYSLHLKSPVLTTTKPRLLLIEWQIRKPGYTIELILLSGKLAILEFNFFVY